MPMNPVTVYSTTWCPWCDRAKALLSARGIEYQNVNIDDEPNFRQKLLDLTGGYTVPQIVIGERPSGGLQRRLAGDARGDLVNLLDAGGASAGRAAGGAGSGPCRAAR